MATFDWQLRPSRNFGDVLVPVAVVQIQALRGTFLPLSMYVDSGSVCTLVRRSLAQELGLALESGRRIRLSNVAGGGTDAFVHNLTLRFADGEPTLRAPIAIAAADHVPNLLGRLGIFGTCRIEFDPDMRVTRIESPERSP